MAMGDRHPARRQTKKPEAKVTYNLGLSLTL
jgi:hypothetical protein